MKSGIENIKSLANAVATIQQAIGELDGVLAINIRADNGSAYIQISHNAFVELFDVYLIAGNEKSVLMGGVEVMAVKV